jgi:hypothetical protein
VTLGFYAVQIFLVAHWAGRAAAGYYAPTLPISGAYLWRYVKLVQRHARLLLIAFTTPAMAGKIKRHRHAILEELDQALESQKSLAGSQ